MRLLDIARLYRVRLRARSMLVQEALAISGISIGVALLFASQIASTSFNRSAQQLTDGIVGKSDYQLRSRSTQGIDERVVDEVQRLPDVRSVVPVLEQDIGLIGPGGRLWVDLVAADPRTVQLAGGPLQGFSPQHFRQRLVPLAEHLIRSSSPADQRVIQRQLIRQSLFVLPASVARSIGARSLGLLKVQVGARIIPGVLATASTAPELAPLQGSRIVVAPLAYAQQLTGMPGKITRVLVQAMPGKQLIVGAGLRRLADGRQNVEPADFDATLFRQAATPVNQSTATFAAICALVGFMFAYCSILLSTPTRRRLVRELHVLGATRAQILKALLFDVFVLAVLGCVVGLVLGDILSILVFHSSPGFLAIAFPVGSQRIVSWQSAALAVGAGLLSACIGVLVPLRDAWRTQRNEHVSRLRSTRGWWSTGVLGGGLVCLAATTVLLLAAPGSAIVGIATLIAALLLLLPLLIAVILAVFRRVQRSLGTGATAIAVLELRAPATRIRSIAIASTAAIAVFGSVTIEGSRTNLQAGLDSAFHGITSAADLWVVPSGSQSLVGTVPFEGLSPSRFAGLPGVRAVGIYRSSFLEVGGRRVWVIAPSSTAITPLPQDQLAQGQVRAVSARLREGGWAVVSQALAEYLHLHLGQHFSLPSPNPMSVKVAGLSTNLGWSPGAVTLNARDYVRAWGSSDPTAYNIIVSRGAVPATVRREIQQLLRSEGMAGLSVQTAAERERSQAAAARQGLTRLTQMALLALIAGILATAASVSAAVSQRKHQIARLKVQGLPRGMVWAAIVWESALLIGAGCLIGAVFGIYGELLLSHALVSVTGFPVVLSVRADIALESFAFVTVAAAAVIAIPGYRMASVRPGMRP